MKILTKTVVVNDDNPICPHCMKVHDPIISAWVSLDDTDEFECNVCKKPFRLSKSEVKKFVFETWTDEVEKTIVSGGEG